MSQASIPKAFLDPTKPFDIDFDEGPTIVSKDDKPYKNTGEPKYSFLGKPIYSPFGIPAGPLPNAKYIKYAFERGFDVVVYKTQRSVEFKVNDFPNMVYVDVDGDLTLEAAAKGLKGSMTTDKPPEKISITNSFGNPSRGPEFWVNDLKKAHSHQGKGQLLVGGAVGTIKEGFNEADYFKDFADTALLAKNSGVEAVEVNLSCPNVASEGVLCYTRSSVLEITRLSKEKLGDTPLIIKLGYYSPQQQKLLEQIMADISPYIDAISAINTIPAPVYDEKGGQMLPGPGRLSAGVCGAAIKWAGIDMVKRLDAIRKKNGYKYEIIGVGGVMKVDDFKAYRQAGADLVQSATGAMWNPQLASQIKATL